MHQTRSPSEPVIEQEKCRPVCRVKIDRIIQHFQLRALKRNSFGQRRILLRMTSVLEPWELLAYDWSMKTRPSVRALDSRIMLIGITEQDIQAMGRWPLTDATLARALDKLLQHQPRAIGIDIYRDIPVPPGQKALESVLA